MGILVGTRNIQHVYGLPFQLFVTHVKDEYLVICYITFMYWMCFKSFLAIVNLLDIMCNWTKGGMQRGQRKFSTLFICII
jgi:hypothetical protein